MKQQKEVILYDQLGKIAPHNIDAEIFVLGAVLINKDAIYSVIDELQPEYFYKEAHQHIFKAFVELTNSGDPIDLLTVTTNLRAKQLLEFVGGPAYIVSLTDRIASAANIEVHSRIIKETFIKRHLITKSSNIIQLAYDQSDLGECLSLSDDLVDSVTNIITSNKEVQHISKKSNDVITDIEQRKDNFENNRITAIPTGIRSLDFELYGGWQNSDFIIIGGRPGMGKTAFMLKFALAAAENGKHVVFFQLEMTKKKLIERLLASVTNVKPRKIKSGNLSEYEIEELKKGMEYLKMLPIYIDETENITAQQIRAKVKRLKTKGLCDIVFIDYLQLIDHETGSNANYKRHEQVAASSRILKLTAKTNDVPIVSGCQLSRATEATASKKPTLKDLRESGAIEQDADSVMFPHRPAYYKEDGYQEKVNGEVIKEMGELIIAKYREGGVGEVPFLCNESITKISDYSENDNYIPDEFTMDIERRIARFKNKDVKLSENVSSVKSLPINEDFDY